MPDSTKVGCVAKIKQSIRTPEKLRILAEGQTRATALTYKMTGDYISADLMSKPSCDGTTDIVVDAYMREAITARENHKFLHISDEFIIAAQAKKTPRCSRILSLQEYSSRPPTSS